MLDHVVFMCSQALRTFQWQALRRQYLLWKRRPSRGWWWVLWMSNYTAAQSTASLRWWPVPWTTSMNHTQSQSQVSNLKVKGTYFLHDRFPLHHKITLCFIVHSSSNLMTVLCYTRARKLLYPHHIVIVISLAKPILQHYSETWKQWPFGPLKGG